MVLKWVKIFHQTLGPLVLGWAPNHFVLGAQLAPGEKRLVCIPGIPICLFTIGSNISILHAKIVHRHTKLTDESCTVLLEKSIYHSLL